MFKQFATIKEMNDSLNPKDMDTAYCLEDKQMYRFMLGKWKSTKIKGKSNVSMTAYEMNSQIISQLPSIADKDILASDLYKDTFKFPDQYYVLLSWDMNYFTVFNKVLEHSDEQFKDIFLECLHSVSDTIYSITPISRDGYLAYEIWVKNPKTDLAAVMYYSNYDNGVIELAKEG